MKNNSTTYAAILMKVSSPQTRGDSEYYQLGFKTASGKRILVVLGVYMMGWSGNLSKSKIYYYHEKGKRLIKTSMKNPEHFIGQQFKITGFLQTISKKEEKYRFFPLERLVYYPK
ncbi:MAG: hypothetical protein ACTSWK_13250 [Promethearchaeota archaeon]